MAFKRSSVEGRRIILLQTLFPRFVRESMTFRFIGKVTSQQGVTYAAYIVVYYNLSVFYLA